MNHGPEPDQDLKAVDFAEVLQAVDDLAKLRVKIDDQRQVFHKEIDAQQLRLLTLGKQLARLDRMADGLRGFCDSMDEEETVTTNVKKRTMTFDTRKRNGVHRPRRISPKSRVLVPGSARARILDRLRHGSYNYHGLVGALKGIPKGTISGTLAELKRKGLVKASGERRNLSYSLVV